MPKKYKVGDVAALFSKPSAPKTETGKKIQSMFDDFYKNSKKLNKPNHAQFEQRKKETNNKEEFSENPREGKKKKRKHEDEGDSVSNLNDSQGLLNKQKKPKLNSAHQNSNKKNILEESYFPRNKKKSKHFNSVMENSSAFSKMHFNDGEDESFSHFDSGEQKPSGRKEKKGKKLSQAEKFENKGRENSKSQFSKKMKKFVDSRNQSEELNVTNDDVFDEGIGEKQSPHSQSKKKKNKTLKKGKFARNDSVVQDTHLDTEDIEAQNESDKRKHKQKSKNILTENTFLNEDSETDENSESSKIMVNKKMARKKPAETADRLSRTLFVGNLPVGMKKHALQKLFSRFGSIETCRVRGSVPVKTTIPKKVAAIKNEFHAGQKSCIGYVVFKETKDAIEALSLNGTLSGDHHLVVNPASSSNEKKTYDEKRSIFIGNLPFDVEDEAIWSAFSVCGEVEAVRAIRDADTGAGKGFGYVLFKNIGSKAAALKMENIEISDRQIRIQEVKSKFKRSAPTSNNNKLYAIRKAKKLKGKQDGPNSRKSLKKLMNREKRNYHKKKIVGIFKKFSI